MSNKCTLLSEARLLREDCEDSDADWIRGSMRDEEFSKFFVSALKEASTIEELEVLYRLLDDSMLKLPEIRYISKRSVSCYKKGKFERNMMTRWATSPVPNLYLRVHKGNSSENFKKFVRSRWKVLSKVCFGSETN